jgi:hypothetical protein
VKHINDRRLARIEQCARKVGAISEPPRKVFHFISDPEGVEKCARENPGAMIIHHVIVDHVPPHE